MTIATDPSHALTLRGVVIILGTLPMALDQGHASWVRRFWQFRQVLRSWAELAHD